TLACLVMKLTPEEVLTAVTINAAAAINRQDDIGSLEVGKKADIVLFDTPNLEYLIYHFGINHTDTVIKNGQIVYQKTS
ncbi:MAG TPA: amidohydrolase family protein, partial [Erysipelothrix sp.]|nr:amidohydrolase family protein [Erysipelothrix sp.]